MNEKTQKKLIKKFEKLIKKGKYNKIPPLCDQYNIPDCLCEQMYIMAFEHLT